MKKKKSKQSVQQVQPISKYNYELFRKVVLLLRSIKHDIRVKIIDLLQEHGEQTVTDLYIRLRIEQSVCSQHLAILRRAGIVKSRRNGKFIYYSININVLRIITNYQSRTSKARALAHKVRIQILEYIESQGNTNVSSIYSTLKLEQSIVSTHLNILKKADLVDTIRDSRFIIYKVTNVNNVIAGFNAFIESYNGNV